MWSFLFLISTCLLGACWGQPELSCLYSLICTSVPKLMQRQRACPRSHSYRLAQIIPVFSASGLSLQAKCPLTAPTGISLCESIQRSCHGLPHSRISYFPSFSANALLLCDQHFTPKRRGFMGVLDLHYFTYFEEKDICIAPLKYLPYILSYSHLQYFIQLYCFE